MISLLLVALIVSGGLAFASGTQESTTGEAAGESTGLEGKDLVTEQRIGNPDAEVTLSMTVLPSSYWTTPYESRANYLEQAYEEWAKAHPNVKVEVTTLSTNIGEAMVKLIEQARVGNAPDLIHVDSFFLPRFYDYLQPIGEYVSEERLNDYFPFVREGMTNNDGQVVAIWPETDVRGLYYRTDLVSEPPKTWDELVETASRISEETDLAGYLFPAGRGEGTTFSMLPFFWAQGGKLIDENGRPVFAEGQNREYMLNILRFFERLIESGASPQKVTQFRTLGEFNSEVAARAVAMFPGGNWQKQMFYDILPEEEADKWEIAPFPQVREGINSSGSGGWAWGFFTSDETKQKAAVDLVRSVYENPKWHEIAGPLPSWKSAYEEYEYFAENKYAQQFAEFLEFSNARPGLPIYTTISSEMQVAVSEVVTGQSEPEAALDTAWNNVMQEYNASN
jgi:multiple sugar transport system substrate-binding protein